VLGAISSNVWIPIATLLLGYIASLVTEALRDRRLSDREREARAAEREAVRESHERERIERRKDFQRETLLHLQDVLLQLVRTFGEEHNQDVMLSRKAGDCVVEVLRASFSAAPVFDTTRPHANAR
jgi:hypothetical protein